MNAEFMDRLQLLRKRYGSPVRINSGYRDVSHPVEAKKRTRGAHTYGRAVDIDVTGKAAYAIVKLALELGFSGIGISLRSGVPHFVHLDDMTSKDGFHRPTMWSY